MDVLKSDRVGIFLEKTKLERDHCLEVDPNGKVLYYKASYYREFDFSWRWPKNHLFTKRELVDNVYKVDITIS